MQTILITGGTGLIGHALIPLLQEQQYNIIVLTRSAPDKPLQDVEYALWDIKQKLIDVEALQKADYIVHLAGAGVMDHKWTNKYKQEIIDSRVESSKLIVDSLAQNKNEVKAIVSASAIGWYGPDVQKGKAFTEDDPPADDYLGKVCLLWEESISEASALNIRVVKIRTGIVLDDAGGALKEFVKPLKFGVGGILGDGKQMVSWIHIKDHCRIILQAIQHQDMQGAYNSVAPEPVSNKTLVKKAAQIKKGSFYISMHVPTFFLKLMLGQRSVEILKSTTVSCTKIKETGFTFAFPSLGSALEDLLG